MLSSEVYKRFLLKINKNDTNSDIDVSKAEFVLLYNEEKDRWLRKIKENQSNDSLEDLQDVQVKHFELTKDKDSDLYSTFLLPSNFFKSISSYSFCSDGSCKDVLVRHFPMKPRNENMLLENSNTEPSLELEETVVDLSDNKLYVYKKDFNIDKTIINYYRQIGAIDIAGYRKLDGSPSVDIHPDVSDPIVNEIVSRCALEVIRRYENPQGFQIAQNRIDTE